MLCHVPSFRTEKNFSMLKNGRECTIGERVFKSERTFGRVWAASKFYSS
jgi:hypothetical protein